MGGLVAVAGLLPKALANPDRKTAAPAAPALTLRPESRAVARKDGTL